VSDLAYILITLASFAALALLIGVLDRWLAEPRVEETPAETPVRELTRVGR
jgi:hypothetical protein